ncbi:hypothetical protein D9615_007526 [Tricholomella constricta]|uniref:HNH nuclease domain-containing protein n=1 Tax=Tricholomella constricta TaxID=117010 RepID=A0A8H5H7G2_9AGAR|nr:hypothetical protein D9615_007526 [Tricholomella constricta]
MVHLRIPDTNPNRVVPDKREEGHARGGAAVDHFTLTSYVKMCHNLQTSCLDSTRSKSSLTSSFAFFPSIISLRSGVFTEAVNNLKTSSTPLPRLVETATALISTIAAHERKNVFEYNGFKLELHAVLQAMLDNAESCGGQDSKRYTASAICLCTIVLDDPDNGNTLYMLRELAITWVTHLLFVCLIAASFSTRKDNTPSFGSMKSDWSDGSATLREQLLQREGRRCVVSGLEERSSFFLHGCHIINLPRAIAISVSDSQREVEGDQDADADVDVHSSDAMTTFDIFQNYTNLSREAIRGLEDDDFNDPSNGILLEFNARYGFRHYQWCLQETEVPGRYRVRVYGSVHGLINLDPTNRFVEVKDHSEEILQRVSDQVKCKRRREVPLPSPRYLRIHATIARVLYTSGAGSFLDDLLMRYDSEMRNHSEDGGVVRSWEEFERVVETANLRENPKCPHCPDDDETIRHYLYQRSHYRYARADLVAKLGRDAHAADTLYGTRKGVKSLLQYVADTDRLKDTFGDVTPYNLTDDDEDDYLQPDLDPFDEEDDDGEDD